MSCSGPSLIKLSGYAFALFALLYLILIAMFPFESNEVETENKTQETSAVESEE